MHRREFLIGLLALGGGVATRPLFAHPGRFHAVESGSYLLLMTQYASRESPAFAQGLSADQRFGSGMLPRLWSIDAATRSFGNRLSSSDRRQLERNLSFFADHFEEVLDRDDAEHFCAFWNHQVSHRLFEARGHVEACGSCRRVLEILIQGSDLEMIPFLVGEVVTVIAGPLGAGPKRRLQLPRVPDSLRPSLAGKELKMRVSVDRNGVASVTGVDSPDISEFVVRRAVYQVESTPWAAATRASNRSVDDSVSVVFRWES